MLLGDFLDTVLNIVVFIFVGVLIALLIRSDLPQGPNKRRDQPPPE